LVIRPVDFPRITIDTFETGLSFSSITLPLIHADLVCEKEDKVTRSKRKVMTVLIV
jgi:hypothetical protein